MQYPSFVPTPKANEIKHLAKRRVCGLSAITDKYAVLSDTDALLKIVEIGSSRQAA